MEQEMTLNTGKADFAAGSDWLPTAEDAASDLPFIIRPSWHVMVAQLAGTAPDPIRISDFGRGSRVISCALSGGQEERDLDDDDEAEEGVRLPMH